MMDIETLAETSLPGMVGGKQSSSSINSDNYSVRYYLANITDLTQMSELERILTKGLDGKDVVIIEKDKYSFQDQYFVVVTYLEKRNAS